MKHHHYNFIWIGILVASLVGAVLLVKMSYANPLGLPDFAFTKPNIKEAYTFAKMNHDMLDGLPCNCGCMDPTKAQYHGGRLHSRGLLDCFMNGDVENGGSWDQHASECGLCYEDALQAKGLYEEGKTKEEVKQFLEDKYAGQKLGTETVWDSMGEMENG